MSISKLSYPVTWKSAHAGSPHGSWRPGQGNAGLESRGASSQASTGQWWKVQSQQQENWCRADEAEKIPEIKSLFPQTSEAAASGKEERLDPLSTDHLGGSLCHWY